MAIRRELSWAFPDSDQQLSGFEIYVREASVPGQTLGESLGTRVGATAARERSFTVELEEGRYLGYVVPFYRDGSRGDALEAAAIEFIESGRDAAHAITSPPAAVGIAQVDATPQAKVVLDPPAKETSAPHLAQIVEGGADPLQGKVVAEQSVTPGGPMSPNASRQPGPSVSLEGAEGPTDMPATRAVWVRAVNSYGAAAATPRSRTLPIVPRPHHDAIAVCSIVGTTRSGISAPAASASWELDASDGIRLKGTGTGSSADASWTGSAGAFVEQQYSCAPYFQKATLEFDEIDIGADVLFVLECFDQVQRKTLVSPAWATMTGDAFMFPSAPGIDVAGREAHPTEGPYWAMRQLTAEGKPTQPLRACKWQYVIGTSSSVPHADADYRDYVQGETLKGRYVRVRLVLVEPTGFHQLICPKAIVTARVVMRRETWTGGDPEGVLTRPPGSLITDKNAATVHWKASGYGNTGWVKIADRATVAGRYHPVGPFLASGLTAATTGQVAGYGVTNLAIDFVAPWAGKLKAISAFFSAGLTAGQATIKMVRNGTAVTTLVLAQTTTAAQVTGEGDTFAAGDTIRVAVDTDVLFNATAGSLAVTLFLQFD